MVSHLGHLQVRRREYTYVFHFHKPHKIRSGNGRAWGILSYPRLLLIGRFASISRVP